MYLKRNILLQRHFLFGLCLFSCQILAAQVTELHGQTASGAYYTIALPENWQPQNGLVIWNHGYQGYTMKGLDSDPSLGPLEDVVLAQGYAMAASSYSQAGWAVFNSHIDNQQLYEQFVELAGRPGKVFIQGASLGGIISVRDLEAGLIPEIDGALLMCGAVAGSENWIEAFDLRMVYEAVCDQVSNAELPTDSWMDQPEPIIGEAKFLESLERCTGLISSNFLEGPLGALLRSRGQNERLDQILDLTNTNIEFLLLNLGYAVFEIPSLVNDAMKLDGLLPFGNAGVDYGDDDINNRVQRSVALPSSRRQFMENYTPLGNIGKAKVVSIHTSKDGLVRVENQLVLESLLLPTQLTTAVVIEDTPSHCEFSEDEGLAAWTNLLDWSAGAAQPSVLDLQQSCQLSNQDPEHCRFDPAFQFRESLLSYPRENISNSPALSSFDSTSNLLSIKSLQVVGNELDYEIELLRSQANNSFFTIEVVQSFHQNNLWQQHPLFFPDETLLYVPNLQVLPDSENNTRFNLFMKYISTDEQEGLQLLEFEIVN
jgi:hypothetical protein